MKCRRCDESLYPYCPKCQEEMKQEANEDRKRDPIGTVRMPEYIILTIDDYQRLLG